MRKGKKSSAQEAFDWKTNSLFQHLKKCIGNSIENMHTDAAVKGMKEESS